MRDGTDELVEALIADGEMQEMKAYLEEGRAYASMTDQALNQRWVAALTAVAFGDDVRLAELCDLGAELRLRGLPPPEQRVLPEAMAALHRRISDSTPEDFEAVAENIGRVRKRWESDAARHS